MTACIGCGRLHHGPVCEMCARAAVAYPESETAKRVRAAQ